jgi:hypothetical protein
MIHLFVFLIVVVFNLYWMLNMERFKAMYLFKHPFPPWFSIMVWGYAFWGFFNLIAFIINYCIRGVIE